MSISVLDFEKPIAEIADKIDALRVAAVENPDLLPQINKLKIEESALRKKIYSKLSTWQKVQVARHPNRPHTLDFIERIFDEFEELHGDRQFADDGSLVGGLANLEGIPVVVLAPRDKYYKKTISNMQEVIARGAKILLITNKNKEEIVSENIWEKIEVENTADDLLPFLITIPLQKLAYYSALKKGYDIDKPRNLAKSVTVE